MKKNTEEAKSKRIDGHSKILHLLKEVFNECSMLIDSERNEREDTQNGICTLLEETCVN